MFDRCIQKRQVELCEIIEKIHQFGQIMCWEENIQHMTSKKTTTSVLLDKRYLNLMAEKISKQIFMKKSLYSSFVIAKNRYLMAVIFKKRPPKPRYDAPPF